MVQKQLLTKTTTKFLFNQLTLILTLMIQETPHNPSVEDSVQHRMKFVE